MRQAGPRAQLGHLLAVPAEDLRKRYKGYGCFSRYQSPPRGLGGGGSGGAVSRCSEAAETLNGQPVVHTRVGRLLLAHAPPPV